MHQLVYYLKLNSYFFLLNYLKWIGSGSDIWVRNCDQLKLISIMQFW
jgi:hypothetical protein